MKKPLILTFCRYYLPGYRAGGPIRTLMNMVDRLGDDFDFHIVTLDRDLGDSARYIGCHCGSWIQVGNAKVMYFPSEDVSQKCVIEVILQLDPDIIYLNSFFDPVFTQRVLWARRLRRIGRRPVVIAPRGECSDGAFRLKYTKKRIYLALASMLGLYHGLTWQASSDLERADIERNLGVVAKRRIHVAMDLAAVESQSTIVRALREVEKPLRVCFLSRISPMKNLDFALRVLAAVKSEIVFTIYGPKEDPIYWSECESLITSLQSNIRIKYAGEVHPNEVKHCLAQHDLFFFPTRGENYGHVIHEALRAGLPVLISDQTPWGEVDRRGVGWTYPLDNMLAFAQKIDELASWSEDRFESVMELALQYAEELAVKAEVLQANRMLFLSVIELAKS